MMFQTKQGPMTIDQLCPSDKKKHRSTTGPVSLFKEEYCYYNRRFVLPVLKKIAKQLKERPDLTGYDINAGIAGRRGGSYLRICMDGKYIANLTVSTAGFLQNFMLEAKGRSWVTNIDAECHLTIGPNVVRDLTQTFEMLFAEVLKQRPGLPDGIEMPPRAEVSARYIMVAGSPPTFVDGFDTERDFPHLCRKTGADISPIGQGQNAVPDNCPP